METQPVEKLKTPAEPPAKKKLNNYSVAQLQQLKSHLEAAGQQTSDRYRQVMDLCF